CGRHVRKTGPWIFDLGGIAKGFAVDQAVKQIQVLDKKKVISGVVNAGGDLRCWGKESFLIQVRIQTTENPELRSFQLRETSVATSVVRSGRDSQLAPAGHIHMPKQQPLCHPQSVAVFAENCTIADALTKIVLTEPGRASDCMAAYQAKAVVFNQRGTIENVW